MNLSSFSGKVAIVTGATSGIGKDMARMLAEAGCKVVIIGRSEEKVKEVVKEIGRGVEGGVCDVRDSDGIKKIVTETAEKYGRIDFLFNNAGVAIAGEVRDISLEDWKEVIDTNLYGVINGVAAAYPVMTKQKFGHIVNISSIAGLVPMAIEIPYSTAKFGLVGLSHSLRMEGKRLGVKVSVACPGGIKTPIWNKSKVVGTKHETAEDLLKEVWMPPFIESDKAANIILKGVLRNKATILTDFSSQVLWCLYKTAPEFYLWAHERHIVKTYHSMRS